MKKDNLKITTRSIPNVTVHFDKSVVVNGTAMELVREKPGQENPPATTPLPPPIGGILLEEEGAIIRKL